MTAALQNMIIKIKHLLISKEEEHARPIARPVRDWKVILCVVALGIVLDAGFAGLVYYDSSGAGASQIDTSAVAPKSKLKAAELKAVLDAFSARATMHANYTQGGGGLSDPSR
jgi:hypothetical protein